VRPHAYAAAILRIGASPRLSAASLAPLAEARAAAAKVPWPRATARAILDATVLGLRTLAARRGEAARRLEAALPGRVATIESFAIVLGEWRGRAIQLPDTIGWAKIPDVRGFPFRDTFSWDASGFGSPQALVLDADFVAGTRPEWYLSHPHIATSMYLYLRSFRRRLLYPGKIDEPLAARGRAAFEDHCARCHGFYVDYGDEIRPSYRERVIPQADVGTDPTRAVAVSDDFVDAANSYPLTKGLTRVRRTGGYVPPVLLDVWARGVYGHVGQWPSIAVIAMPPEKRPRHFVVDTDGKYDLVRLGQAYQEGTPSSLGPGAYVYDGDRPGYDVGGHPFLAALPEADRRAVIEYLKTL
jgi:hypothetical protein